MVVADCGEFGVGAFVAVSVEEDADFGFPSPQVLPQDLCLVVVSDLDDVNDFALASKMQFAGGAHPDIANPLRLTPRCNEVALGTNGQEVDGNRAPLARRAPRTDSTRDPRMLMPRWVMPLTVRLKTCLVSQPGAL